MTVPPLPRPVGRRSFLKQTVAEWESWPWGDFTPAQAAHAARTIVLIDDLNRSGSATERIKLDQAVRQALRVLGLTKKDDEDEGPSEEDIAEFKRVSAETYKIRSRQEAIRLGVDVADVGLMFVDREGQVHDIRNTLIADTWDAYPDAALQDERQAEAETEGTWPDAPVQIPIAEGNEAREGTA
jgi:hypothetical protein